MTIDKPYYYIRESDGSVRAVSDVLEWGMAFETSDRRIDETFLGDGAVRVSTVFLGIDHQFGDGPPLIYETMVFVEEPDSALAEAMDLYCDRYSTEAEARAGHQSIVEQVRTIADDLRATGKPEPPPSS